MAIVVEQTIPFPASTLDLESSTRWNHLLPLIRPSIKEIATSKGPTILLDTHVAQNRHVHTVAVGTPGNFSSTLLDSHAVLGVVPAQSGAGHLTAQDVQQAIHSNGTAQHQGLVVVRVGKRRHLESHGSDLIEVATNGLLEQDHILQLLSKASEMARSSMQHTIEMLKAYVNGDSVAHSIFHVEKAEGNPAVLHVGGAAGFEKAKHAVERDLKHVLSSQQAAAPHGDVVYSVHYSDVNGLSRLENYILAKEIAEYLDSSQLSYRLSHSTILDHKSLPRGFSISICPISSRYLTPQAAPQPYQSAQIASATSSKGLAPPTSQIAFQDAAVRQRIEAGCNAVIAAEPTITEYDTIVGDGDCGYTLRDGANQVLRFIADRDLSQLPSTLGSLVEDLEVNMGGTSGALYCIYLTALAGALATEGSVAEALKVALEQLMKYTNARLGDRTMMDALIPFVETLAGTGDAKAALSKAAEGVEGTKTMEAKLGRSTYLDESATQGVPDPGAYGLLVLLNGMAEAA